MKSIIPEPVKYFYVIHGSIPELMPNVAFRRENREQQCRRKTLKCPCCARRLTDTDMQTRVELYQHPVRVNVSCQFYMKCFHCGSEIGINIA